MSAFEPPQGHFFYFNPQSADIAASTPSSISKFLLFRSEESFHPIPYPPNSSLLMIMNLSLPFPLLPEQGEGGRGTNCQI
jgi:hypothetical protein